MKSLSAQAFRFFFFFFYETPETGRQLLVELLAGIAEGAGSPAGLILQIIDSGATGNSVGGIFPLTVGGGTGFDRDMVDRDTATLAENERKEKDALGIYCEFSDPAVRAAALASHAAYEEAATAMAERCPVYAESRRLTASA